MNSSQTNNTIKELHLCPHCNSNTRSWNFNLVKQPCYSCKWCHRFWTLSGTPISSPDGRKRLEADTTQSTITTVEKMEVDQEMRERFGQHSTIIGGRAPTDQDDNHNNEVTNSWDSSSDGDHGEDLLVGGLSCPPPRYHTNRCSFCQNKFKSFQDPGRDRVLESSTLPGEVSEEVRIEIDDEPNAGQYPRWEEIQKDERVMKIIVYRPTDSWVKAGEIILGITGQGAISLLGYYLSSRSSQAQKSPSAALYFVVGANGVGFFGTFTAIFLRRKRRAMANILGKIGAIAGGSGIIAAMGMYLPEEYMTWIAVAACLIPALAVAFD